MKKLSDRLVNAEQLDLTEALPSSGTPAESHLEMSCPTLYEAAGGMAIYWPHVVAGA